MITATLLFTFFAIDFFLLVKILFGKRKVNTNIHKSIAYYFPQMLATVFVFWAFLNWIQFVLPVEYKDTLFMLILFIAMCMFTIFTFYALNFPIIASNKANLLLFFANIPSFIVAGLALSGKYFSGIQQVGNITIPVYSSEFLKYLYGIVIGYEVLVFLIIAINRYNILKGLDRLIFKSYSLGLIISLIIGIIGIILLPLAGIHDLRYFTAAYGLPFLISAYTTLYYDRFDGLRTTFNKIAAVFFISAFIVGLIFLIISIELNTLGISLPSDIFILNIIVCLGLVFIVLYNIQYIYDFILRILRDDPYKFNKLLEKLNDVMDKNTNITQLLSQSSDLISSVIDGSKISVLTSQNTAAPKLEYLEENVSDFVITQELINNQYFKKYLESENIAIIQKVRKHIFMIITQKNNSEALFAGEIRFLTTFISKIKYAYDRYDFYENMSNVNQYLEKEVKKQTEKIQQAYTELQKADKAQSDFISIASHQLRTPTSIIRNYISMIQSGDFGKIDPGVHTVLDKSEQAIADLLNIIENILNASRIDSNKMSLELSEVDICALMRSIISQLNNKAVEKNLKITFSTNNPVIKLKVDEMKFSQVIINLLENSLSYTKLGGIFVDIEENARDIMISVKDTGIGIPKGKEKELFKKFSRLDNAKRLRPDGTGIGLYTVKSIIDLHGGEIYVNSVEGQGTEFVIIMKK